MNAAVLERKNKPNDLLFKPALYSWFITLIGLGVYFLSLIFLLFGLVIFLYRNLRQLYMNWVIASAISAVILLLIAKYIINNYGAKYLKMDNITISFKSPFGKTLILLRDDLLHVEINYPNPILEKISLSSPSIIFITHNRVVKVRTKHWSKSQEIIDFYQDKSNEIVDEFALYYHKSKQNFSKLILRFSQDTPGMIGLTIITIYTFFALWGALAMLISPIEYYATHTLFLRNPMFQNYDTPGYDWDTAVLVPPGKDFWFGTDFIGRDLFSRIIFGTTFTFLIAIVGSTISIAFILFFGLTSAFFGGWWDNVVTRVSDTLLTFPPFILLLLFSTLSIGFVDVIQIRGEIQGGYFLVVFTGMAFVTWPLGARLIRAEVIETLNTEYILAARQIGSSNIRILTSHIFPKIAPILLILFSYQFTDIILGTTLLGFIGYGSESTLTWGSDLAHASFADKSFNNWWTVLFPTLALFFLVFGLAMLTDSVRDALDPKLRGGIKAVPFEYRYEVGM